MKNDWQCQKKVHEVKMCWQALCEHGEDYGSQTLRKGEAKAKRRSNKAGQGLNLSRSRTKGFIQQGSKFQLAMRKRFLFLRVGQRWSLQCLCFIYCFSTKRFPKQFTKKSALCGSGLLRIGSFQARLGVLLPRKLQLPAPSRGLNPMSSKLPSYSSIF